MERVTPGRLGADITPKDGDGLIFYEDPFQARRRWV